ncbi:hypothetical protein CLF_101456 [Clonorchis sinensis]|uniref:Uncharacterized protein n=2 Tax=Clonorchis sinensis TaxID=79923 RepID=H2KP77_CLOSI|nr:hypothetical protein CLF_101456 [Clonorchis sinensis]
MTIRTCLTVIRVLCISVNGYRTISACIQLTFVRLFDLFDGIFEIEVYNPIHSATQVKPQVSKALKKLLRYRLFSHVMNGYIHLQAPRMSKLNGPDLRNMFESRILCKLHEKCLNGQAQQGQSHRRTEPISQEYGIRYVTTVLERKRHASIEHYNQMGLFSAQDLGLMTPFVLHRFCVKHPQDEMMRSQDRRTKLNDRLEQFQKRCLNYHRFILDNLNKSKRQEYLIMRNKELRNSAIIELESINEKIEAALLRRDELQSRLQRLRAYEELLEDTLKLFPKGYIRTNVAPADGLLYRIGILQNMQQASLRQLYEQQEAAEREARELLQAQNSAGVELLAKGSELQQVAHQWQKEQENLQKSWELYERDRERTIEECILFFTTIRALRNLAEKAAIGLNNIQNHPIPNQQKASLQANFRLITRFVSVVSAIRDELNPPSKKHRYQSENTATHTTASSMQIDQPPSEDITIKSEENTVSITSHKIRDKEFPAISPLCRRSLNSINVFEKQKISSKTFNPQKLLLIKESRKPGELYFNISTSFQNCDHNELKPSSKRQRNHLVYTKKLPLISSIRISQAYLNVKQEQNGFVANTRVRKYNGLTLFY